MRVARPRKGSWAAPPPRLNHVCDSPWGPPERSGPCSLPSALPAGMPVLPGPRPSLLGAPSSSAPGRPCSSLAGVCTTVRACCVAVIAIRQPARGKERECCGHEPQLQGGRSSRGGGGALRENWGLPASGGCAKIWSRGMARDSYNGTSVCMCGKTGAGPAGRSAGEGGTGLEPQGRRGASPAGGPGCKQSAGQAQQFTGAAVRRRWPCGARRPGRGAAGAAPARGAGRPPHQTATRCPPPAGSRRRRPPAAARRAR